MLRLWVLWSIFGGIVLILLRQKLTDKKLQKIKEAIMATEAELDSALEGIGQSLTGVKDAIVVQANKVAELAAQVTKLIEKINGSGTGIDLTDEIAAAQALKAGAEEAAAGLQASSAAVDEAIAKAKAITEPTPPAEPA